MFSHSKLLAPGLVKRGLRFFLSLTLQSERQPDEMLSRVNELYGVFRSSFASIIESGQARGVFRAEIDAARDAALIMASLAGILVQRFMSDGAAPDAKNLIEHLKTTLFQRLVIPAVGSPLAGRP